MRRMGDRSDMGRFILFFDVVVFFFFFFMIRRPPRSTQSRSSAASDVYKRQVQNQPSVGKPTCSDRGGVRG